jgi:hypothetical protein
MCKEETQQEVGSLYDVESCWYSELALLYDFACNVESWQHWRYSNCSRLYNDAALALGW